MNKNNLHKSAKNFLLGHQKRYLKSINQWNYFSDSLKLDKVSYFIITTNKNDKHILVEQFCYNAQGDIYSILFKGQTAKHLCYIIFQISQLNIKISTSHALYLGREFMKSELTLILDQQYIQD